MPVRFPVFPKTDEYIKYRDWKAGVNNFVITSPVIDSVKIQHLKESCKSSEADKIVSLFSIDTDNFDAAMEALDNCFLVARTIIGELLDGVIKLGTKNPKMSGGEHVKLVLDSFNALVKNVDGICKESLASGGLQNPSELQLSICVTDALYFALLLRTVNVSVKTFITSKLNLKPMELPKFADIRTTLEKRVNASQGEERKSSSSAHVTATAAVAGQNTRAKRGKYCVLCPESTNHDITHCFKLLNKKISSKERFQLIRNNPAKKNLCYTCLVKDYNTCLCKSQNRKCELCGRGHHKILCEKFGRQNGANPNQGKTQVNAVAVTATAAEQTGSEQALIGTILLKVKAANGSYIIARAMVDDGSMLSYVTQQMFQQLKLKGTSTYKKVLSMNGQALPPVVQESTLEIQSLNETFEMPFLIENVAVARRVPLILLTQSVELSVPEELRNEINLADPTYGKPGKVDILLGAVPWAQIKQEGSMMFGRTRFQNSIFGHVVQGGVHCNEYINCAMVTATTSADTVASIRNDLKTAFEYEPQDDEKDLFAENLFKEKHFRLENGTYFIRRTFRIAATKSVASTVSRWFADTLIARLGWFKNALHQARLGGVIASPSPI